MAVSESSQYGLDLMTVSTAAFIDNDPVAIALTPGRGTAVETPSGGYDYANGTQRAVQSFKLINSSGDSNSANGDGLEAVKFQYILIGMPDSVVAVGDWWVDGPNRYVVTGILHRNGYQLKATVEAYGQEPNYG